jgi:hypothetical protein
VRAGKVLVDVYVKSATGPAARVLRTRGMSGMATTGRRPARIVEGWLPVAELTSVARLSTTRAVVAVPQPLLNTGAALSQGDAAMRGPQARATGATGAGVPVGIMSDSINKSGGGVAGSQSTGDLPPNVQVLDDPASGSDEGRAMAEIVYDEVPGIPKILFATGTGGPVHRADNIDALVAAGAKVIADDVVYLGEPAFQDGVVAQAADAARAAGVPYFVSAGNRARQSWEGSFVPGTGNQNNFAAGGPEDLRNTIATIPTGGTMTLALSWDEPLGAVTTDFDVDVYATSAESTSLLNMGSDNIATGVPVEAGTFTNTTGAPLQVSIAITRFAGTHDAKLKLIANVPGAAPFVTEHGGAAAIDPDAASAAGALSVAAVYQGDSGLNSAEPFSSRGPSVTRYFDAAGNRLATPDVRPKPDIAAPDGVSTTFSGASGLSPFFGTSAAAPGAAGIAALLMSAKPSLPISELSRILTNPANSNDCDAPGDPDADCGAGFLQADRLLNQVLDATPPDITPVTSPGAPNGANGWFTGDVGLTWNVSDAGSPVDSTSNCGPSSATTDSIVTFTCSATSAGGTRNQPFSIKRDASPPSAPTFTGIRGSVFSASSLPRAPGCTAGDPTSGLAACFVTGRSTSRGAHVLVATAVNGAGLTHVATRPYTIRTAAASGLRVPRTVKISTLLGSGLPVQLRAAAAHTTLSASLALNGKVSKAAATVIGRTRKSVKAGRARLTIKLNRKGRTLLGSARAAKLQATLSASSRNTAPATLTAKLSAKR